MSVPLEYAPCGSSLR